MSKPSRREALKQLGAASAAFALTPLVWRGQGTDLMLAGRPGEVVVTGVNAVTTRIVIQQIDGSDTSLQDGALLERGWRAPVIRKGAGASTVRVPGTNVDVAIDVNPFRISVRSGSRTWQQLTIDGETGSVTFPLGDKPVLGFGEGGAQFDRRGVVDRMRSGQGQGLATQGARVPIQWLVGTGGYALYIHRPIGTFDLTTTTAKFDPAGPPPATQVNRPPPTAAEAPPESPKFPIDLFVVASDDPATIMRGWIDITGAPEMPALWTLGYLQSHRTLDGADDRALGGQDDAREEAAVRRADLSRHRLHAVGLEHAQRRVHVESRELSRSEGDDRRAARRALQGRAAHRHRRTPAHRHGGRSVHGAAAAAGTHAGFQGPVAERAAGLVLLAGAQAAVRPRRRRLVARSGRRLRRRRRGSRASACTGKAASCIARTSGRSRCIATAMPACSDTRRFSGRAT